MTKKQSFCNALIFLTVFAIFSCSLVVPRLVNICFYLLLCVALFELIFLRNQQPGFWATCKQHRFFCAAMCASFAAVLIRQMLHGEFTLRLYDLPARLALFAVVFWLLLQLSSGTLRKLKWGFIFGVIIYALNLYVDTNGGNYRIGNLNSFSIIFSSELALLMGTFAILSIGWSSKRSVWTVALQIVAGACGLYSVYLSQTRGAWIAIPFIVFITVSTLMHGQKSRTKILTYVAILATLIVLFSATNIGKERLIEGKSDLTEFADKKNLDTSIGVRFQLWNASLIMFKEHPVVGVGKEHFSEELQNLKQRGIVTEAAAMQYHSHNECLYGMATLGIFGLFAILITYLVPAYYFAKFMFHQDVQIHAASAMGLCLCIGYIIFGSVDVMFGWNMCNVFYSVASALFLAFIANKNKELAEST